MLVVVVGVLVVATVALVVKVVFIEIGVGVVVVEVVVIFLVLVVLAIVGVFRVLVVVGVIMVCDTKRDLPNVQFGVAVYDVDFDSNLDGCEKLEIKEGGFGRLYPISLFMNFLINNYSSFSECQET
ncbi:hypothetical protein MRX96_008698 [Rhipicephalus microplus]